MHTPNSHRPADTDPSRVALAVVVAGQRAILDHLRILTAITLSGILVLVALAVVAILW